MDYLCLSVCPSVCPHDKTKTAETKIAKLGYTCWRVMETGHPSTRAVNSGRQLE